MTTLPGWNYEQPTEAEILAALTAYVGRDTATAVWDALCRQHGIERPVERTADLLRACDHLTYLGTIARVTGRSGKIRAATYQALDGTHQPLDDAYQSVDGAHQALDGTHQALAGSLADSSAGAAGGPS
ncbi:hypothetical protein [Actinoplanes sp. DH11]|uniref:hypothetical protein n=1 Tax=Actinoplanes sp. DH11 TaxID=2857011 RepID=UPI001E54BDCF|nr:hypothetical protein [Actinoplanes sp. DH11]